MEKVKTIVNIGGKEYTIAGVESAEYIHRVAICVNHKMAELKRGNEQLNNTLLAVLTAINIADDYIKLKDEMEEIKKYLQSIGKDPYKQQQQHQQHSQQPPQQQQVNVSKFR
ncbi:MAG: cell division protein ZapA [Eubacteriales bacterium]